MKKIGIIALPLFVLCGCQIGPAKYETSSNKECSFNAIAGKPYRIADIYNQYVTNSFFYNPNQEKVWQLDKKNYRALVAEKFKVLETGVITAEDNKSRQDFLSNYRYSDEEIDQVLYKKDRAYSTKVVTEDCTVYYLSADSSASTLREFIVNADRSKIDDKDVMALYGPQPLQKMSMGASIEYDRFDKRLKIKTPFFDDKMIRGSISTRDNSITLIQLYTSIKFLDDWGHLSYATDTEGNRHEVIKIADDADCQDNPFSEHKCRLTETVGVSLSKDFLERHKEGFELKVAGSQEKIVKVSGAMVNGFLESLNAAMACNSQDYQGIVGCTKKLSNPNEVAKVGHVETEIMSKEECLRRKKFNRLLKCD